MDLSAYTPKTVKASPYHDGVPKRTWQIPPEDRDFIAWDGEGTNVDGPGKPQHYTLFGSSYFAMPPMQSTSQLHTFQLLDYILAVGKANPTAFHVGFAFNYDANMIVRSLHEKALMQLHKTNKLALRRNGSRYFIHYIPSKWFSVSRYGPNYDRKKNPHDKVTVRIYDLFTFFACSFVKAYTDLVGAVPSVVADGKAERNNFSDLGSDYVVTYWREEIAMLRELADVLRERMYGADLRIREWHGPGALASYANKKYGVKPHMAISPDPVREAARYAYAGGRFEMFRLGRINGPIYSMDINSAYPYGITQLPSLATGNWGHVVTPRRIAKFGVYRIRLLPRASGSFIERAPGPLFHRDKMGNISFPWILEGWYWSPEVRVMVSRLSPDQYEVVEGWEYTGWTNAAKPYGWVNDMYQLRREWKAAGNASQLALKLCMNSLYGKMAQRVGWNEEKRIAPTWHQLEWAGWVTSNCRAMLWGAMSKLPRESIIAVETDGLYTTQHPSAILGTAYGHPGRDGLASGTINSSTELGGWEIEIYDEILYVQSGLAWLRKGDKWICKRRGLDARTFGLDDCRDYLSTLKPGERWAPYVGSTTRFIGMGSALASSTPTKDRHGLWETVEREIRPGQGGKRIHVSSQCAACQAGFTPYEAAHEMSIRSLAYKPGNMMSREHDIPWEGEANYDEWRNHGEAAGRETDSAIYA